MADTDFTKFEESYNGILEDMLNFKVNLEDKMLEFKKLREGIMD